MQILSSKFQMAMIANNIISISMAAAESSDSNRRSAQNLAPEYVLDYHANSQTVREFFPALELRLKGISIDQRLVHDASAALVAAAFHLAEVTSEMRRFRADQSRRQAALQSIRSGFSAELDRIGAWKKVSAVLFAIAAAISAAGAAVNATADSQRPLAAAAAAAASILLVAVGKWVDSLLKKPESGVKKHVEVVRAMIVAGKLAIKDLADICELAQDIKNEIKSILKMVGDGAMEADVRNKVAALNNSYEKMLRRANDGSLNAISAREVVLESILKNMG